MIYPLEDVFDRLSIETRKAQYGAKNLKLRKQYAQAIAERCGTFMAKVIVATIELTGANYDISNLEWAVRVNHKDLTPAEVGRRAVAIRDINALRVKARSQLAKYFGNRVNTKRYDHKQKFTSILQPLKVPLSEFPITIRQGKRVNEKTARGR